jgi:hypothetical protein
VVVVEAFYWLQVSDSVSNDQVNDLKPYHCDLESGNEERTGKSGKTK